MPQNKGALSIHLTAVALHGATLLGLCCGIFESWRFLRSKVQRGKSTETCRNSKPFILRIGTLWAFPKKNLHFQVGRFWRWLLWLVFVKKFGRRDDMLQVFWWANFVKLIFEIISLFLATFCHQNWTDFIQTTFCADLRLWLCVCADVTELRPSEKDTGIDACALRHRVMENVWECDWYFCCFWVIEYLVQFVQSLQLL